MLFFKSHDAPLFAAILAKGGVVTQQKPYGLQST
jgi:hypothetical protein